MLNINRQLEDDLKKLEQLERRKRLQDNRKKKVKEKMMNAVISSLARYFFPFYLNLYVFSHKSQTKKTNKSLHR